MEDVEEDWEDLVEGLVDAEERQGIFLEPLERMGQEEEEGLWPHRPLLLPAVPVKRLRGLSLPLALTELIRILSPVLSPVLSSSLPIFYYAIFILFIIIIYFG